MAILLLLLVTGCGGSSGGSEKGDLVVSAASSLKGAFTEYGGARFSFAGSDELAAQIRQGVKPDVFASANTKLPDALFKEGLVEKPRVFAGNRLVLAVPAKDAKVTKLDDLRRPGVTLAIGSASVPVGAYTREVIGKLPHPKEVLANVRSNEPDVKGVVGKLTQGAVDAGFVYVTDVEATKGALKAIELPDAVSPVVSYGVAVVKGAKHPKAAQDFVDGLLDGAGHDALAEAGFSFP
jgi:molybdate transport system substrate-binding protein